MNIQPRPASKPSTPRLERRTNPVLRERFDAARSLLLPILGGANTHNGTALYRAMTQLQTAYPELSGEEIEAMVASVVRSLLQRKAKPPRR